ncbi:MAG TPA: hypothetical protein DEQ26_11825 [Flavobacteriaceae bacterium]|nr:hypothetical protein [Flavobacteriaceae bacterium]
MKTQEQNLEVVEQIISFTEQLINFWKNSKGWAPDEAFEILDKSQLELHLEITKELKIFILANDANKSDGLLVIAWTTLGSLVEGLLKLFLCVYYKDYSKDPSSIKKSNGTTIPPDELMLEKLKNFYSNKIFDESIRKIWKETGGFDWIKWINKIQQRRNSIHSFKKREIGTFQEYFEDLKNYQKFLKVINNMLPYPDEKYRPN